MPSRELLNLMPSRELLIWAITGIWNMWKWW